jgi:hypothetical protein
MRVNARLDQMAEEQITYLTQATGQSVSLVLREAVGLYYQQVRASRGAGPRNLLAMVGQGRSGRTDLSTTYKEEITPILDRKHPRRAAAKPQHSR